MKTMNNIEQRLQTKIGILLSRKRKESNLSIRGLSRLSGVSSTVINDTENARSLPSLRILIKLCEALKLDFNELLQGMVTSSTSIKQNLPMLLSEYGYTKKQIAEIMDFIKYIEYKEKRC